ncbi:MAG: iron ABC transporter permease [Planctomycetaceae bacterium]|jgi:iron complex transport system permease protein|nr:iron ABC transporter permease [Planctomycetaceae bacterium]
MLPFYCVFAVVFLTLAAALLPCLGQTVYLPGTEIYTLRFFRTLLALIAGGGLALCGLVFQATFRNPLATPYTLGVASGAAFGAALCLQTTVRLGLPMMLALPSVIGVPAITFGAFAGAVLAMGIVFALSLHKDASSEQMLLAGVAVNFFFSSMIVLLQYLSAPHDAFQILRWTMGGVQNAAGRDCILLVPITAVLFGYLIFQSRTLNVFVTGQERAMSLGVNVIRFRMVLFVMTSLTVGGIVSVTGPIGFVGLMIPHIARLILGPDHRRLIPATAVLGALFLGVCDTLGRCLFYPAELPVGIITSLLGGPFFLWLLLRRNTS